MKNDTWYTLVGLLAGIFFMTGVIALAIMVLR